MPAISGTDGTAVEGVEHSASPEVGSRDYFAKHVGTKGIAADRAGNEGTESTERHLPANSTGAVKGKIEHGIDSGFLQVQRDSVGVHQRIPDDDRALGSAALAIVDSGGLDLGAVCPVQCVDITVYRHLFGECDPVQKDTAKSRERCEEPVAQCPERLGR